MGLDLKLLPQWRVSPVCDFSHDVIWMARDGELFDLIEKVEREVGVAVDKVGIYSYVATLPNGESGYGRTVETPYGKRMKSVTAKQLKDSLVDYVADDWKNEAGIAYVNALPDDLLIWLYWN